MLLNEHWRMHHRMHARQKFVSRLSFTHKHTVHKYFISRLLKQSHKTEDHVCVISTSFFFCAKWWAVHPPFWSRIRMIAPHWKTIVWKRYSSTFEGHFHNINTTEMMQKVNSVIRHHGRRLSFLNSCVRNLKHLRKDPHITVPLIPV